MLTLTAGDLSLRLGRRGGVIRDFRLRDLALMRPATAMAAPGDSACFPLLPLGNRIRGNCFSFAGREYGVIPNALPEPLHLHGAGWQADWDLAETAPGFARLTHRYDGRNLPHRYLAEQCFQLVPEGLRITLAVTNTGDETLPFGIGWHPFFAPGAVLTAPAQGFWHEGAHHLPVSRGPIPADLDFSAPRILPPRWINSAFDGWTGSAQLTWPDRSLTIKADPVFGCYQLYRPAAGDLFAFEPMSHLPDALSMPDLGGLHPLAPGATLAGGMTLTPRLLSCPSLAVPGAPS